MDHAQAELYERIQQFPLDAVDANLPFSYRLARDNGWTLDYAQRALEEYKKFVFLAIVAGHPVTPSDQVDQVWHLHLLYTQSYWEEFCAKILQTSLHHYPTKGGHQERGKFNDWYSSTLRSYETIFQQSAPTDIWSSPQIRFGRDLAFQRVNVQQHWIIPKPELSWISRYCYPWTGGLFILLILSIVSTSASWAASPLLPPQPIATPFTPFLLVYLWIAGTSLSIVITVSLLLRRFNRQFQFGAPLLSFVGFGLFWVGVTQLLTGLATLPSSEFLGFFGLTAIAGVFAEFMLHRWMQSQAIARLREKGQDYWRELVSPRLKLRIVPQLMLLCVVLLYLLGIVRIGIGLYGHKPSGYLSVLCLGIAAYLVWRLIQSNRKPAIILVGMWGSLIGLSLLLIISPLHPSFYWLLIVGLIWLLNLGRTRSYTRGQTGTTCVNGDCGDSSSGSDSDSGGCGGCGAG